MEIFILDWYLKELAYEGKGKYRLLAQRTWKVKFSFYNKRNLRETNETGRLRSRREKKWQKEQSPKDSQTTEVIMVSNRWKMGANLNVC